jgi:hypothetical protein
MQILALHRISNLVVTLSSCNHQRRGMSEDPQDSELPRHRAIQSPNQEGKKSNMK